MKTQTDKKKILKRNSLNPKYINDFHVSLIFYVLPCFMYLFFLHFWLADMGVGCCSAIMSCGMKQCGVTIVTYILLSYTTYIVKILSGLQADQSSRTCTLFTLIFLKDAFVMCAKYGFICMKKCLKVSIEDVLLESLYVALKKLFSFCALMLPSQKCSCSHNHSCMHMISLSKVTELHFLSGGQT